ncbi:efflux RND transporter periplasmic adaptor subunit [Paracidovorax sp. MALMAid1276]|uniref:efflux RND transporter periplasmic adaptor subunit n=1 Tax=Paracidovorax sp. MALMAid1276 TaxID=3411631 RepID=UPI003B9A8AFB
MTLRRLAPWLLAAAVALVGLGGLVWFGLRGPRVAVVEVQAAPLVRTLQFSARVATLSRVDVGSTLTGRVAAVRVREGDRVQAGDLLVQLEDREWRAALAQAEATEQQARAHLQGLRLSARQAAQAALAQAEATARAADAALERAQQLVAQGFYSAAQRDDVRRAAEVARAQVAGARAQVQANAEGGADIVQALAQRDAAQAATAAAQVRLAQTRLLAPTDARVLQRMVEPGQIVQPGRALVSLALAGPTQLVAPVDERFLDQLRPGQQASVVADAFPAQRFAARVLSLAPAVDAQRGAIEVKLALQGPAPDFLREDMTLSVAVETARRASALALPQTALRLPAPQGTPRDATAPAEDQAEVLVVQGGRTAARTVRLGLRTLDAVEVLQGLEAGARVVRDARSVEPDTRVRAHTEPWSSGMAGPSSLPPAAGAGAGAAGAAMTNAIGR